MNGLSAGTASATITPRVGVDLSGYAARPGPSVGVHDELYCRALVLDDSRARVGIVALDLLGVDLELDAAIREATSACLPPDHLLINCSHTHAGPSVTRLDRRVAADRGYVSSLPRRIAEVVKEAASRLAPATLSYGSAPGRVGINRRERAADGRIIIGRNPEGTVDQEVRALRVATPGGETIAVLFHHACHGTTMGGDNLLISAEWMGAACACLGQRAGAPAMFLQGCAGHTNPDARERSFEEVTRLGRSACEAVLRALDTAEPMAGAPLAARRERIALPLQDPPSPEKARKDLAAAEAAVAKAKADGAHSYWVRALEGCLPLARQIVELADKGASGLTLPFVVQVMRIGELALVGLSGEVFLEFGRQIAAASPFRHTWALGYSNGCECYVPTAEAFAEGGYEAEDSFRWYGTLPLAPEAGDRMAGEAVRLLGAVG
ncbi:MAG: neutral/alkaline non-lysosomal ceramidase N-terminal domain-containing protein [Armatimonadota bacterium]